VNVRKEPSLSSTNLNAFSTHSGSLRAVNLALGSSSGPIEDENNITFNDVVVVAAVVAVTALALLFVGVVSSFFF